MPKRFSYPADQAALDALFNNRAAVPDFGKTVEAWQRSGAAALAVPGWHRDVAYGPGLNQNLDLLVPERIGAARAPLFVFIHGGYWQSLDKSDVRGLGPAFAAKGIAYATLNYALCPAVGIDAIVAQIRAALDYLWFQAPRFGCDPGAIFVGGHSAGGHLAAMLCTFPDTAARIAGCYGVSGVYDLAPLKRSYQQPILQLTDRVVATCSPLTLRPQPGTKLWLAVGAKETPAFLGQQADLAAAWRAAGAAVTVVPAAGLNHFTIVEKLADSSHPVGKAALAMIAAASK
ncbi:MAG: alpha/beta hydrolase [Telmatospirillum sp.]|nr:alpha/beta hydrolase [Telmatospirillum sp.]